MLPRPGRQFWMIVEPEGVVSISSLLSLYSKVSAAWSLGKVPGTGPNKHGSDVLDCSREATWSGCIVVEDGRASTGERDGETGLSREFVSTNVQTQHVGLSVTMLLITWTSQQGLRWPALVTYLVLTPLVKAMKVKVERLTTLPSVWKLVFM